MWFFSFRWRVFFFFGGLFCFWMSLFPQRESPFTSQRIFLLLELRGCDAIWFSCPVFFPPSDFFLSEGLSGWRIRLGAKTVA